MGNSPVVGKEERDKELKKKLIKHFAYNHVEEHLERGIESEFRKVSWQDKENQKVCNIPVKLFNPLEESK